MKYLAKRTTLSPFFDLFGILLVTMVFVLAVSKVAQGAELHPPTNIYTVQGEGFFKINWTPSDSSQVTEYRIYRSSDGDKFNLLATVPPEVTFFNDTNTATAFYRITTADASGTESSPSGITAISYHTMQNTSFRQIAASAAAVGDLNGDGKPDIVLADSNACARKKCAGNVYIYLNGITTKKNAPNFTLSGEKSGDGFGRAIAITDLNKDGFDDLIVGAPFFDPYVSDGFIQGTAWEAGKIYVYLGGPAFNTTPSFTKEGTFSYGNNGDSYYILASENFGYSLASAGDINNDGYSDVAIGVPRGGMDLSGAVKVLYGGPSFGWMGMVRSPVEGDHLGTAVATAGDVNGDGYPDIVAAAPNDLQPRFNKKSYLILGGQQLTISNTIPGGFENFGSGVSGLDFNGDRFSDLILSPYVGNFLSFFFGSTAPDAVTDRTVSDMSVISSIGDMDKDGHGDILVQGSKVIFGTSNPVDFSVMTCPSSLKVIGVGDIDGDGVEDIIQTDGVSVYICSSASFNGLPEIIVDDPAADDFKTSEPQITLAGRIKGDISKLLVGGRVVQPALDGTFQEVVPIVGGVNIIEILCGPLTVVSQKKG